MVRRTAGLLVASLVLALSATPLTPSVRAVGATTWVVAHEDEVLEYTVGSACADPDFWTDGSWSEPGSGDGAYDSDEDAIQDAIDNAASGDTIYVCAGTYDFDAEVGGIPAGADITIVGDGTTETIFDGGGSTRLLNTDPNDRTDGGGTLTVRTLAIADAGVGASDNGGAIIADSIVLNDVVITGSRGAFNGGALYAEGDVAIVDSELSDNRSSRDGAALYAWKSNATTLIESSDFSDNQASNVAGAVIAGGDLTISGTYFSNNESAGDGGAIINTADDAVVIIENSEFAGNTAGNIGGALVMQNLERLEISGTLFSGNRAEDAFGGAMNIFNTEEVIITSSEFVENEARGGDFGGNGNGGAIDACNIDSFTSVSSRYVGNISTQYGGAIGLFGDGCFSPGTVSLRGNKFVGNSATDHGGALWLSGTLTSMVGNRFEGNEAGVLGGAVFGGWWADESLESQVISRNTFIRNQAGGGGGALWLPGNIDRLTRNNFRANSTGGSGGAIAISQVEGRVWRAISGNRILRNSASGNGGAFYLECSSLSRSARSRLVAANQLSGNRAYDDRRTSRIYQANVC